MTYPPLSVMARRLAPFIARGEIDFTEALDCIVEHVIRCRWNEYGDQLDLTMGWVAAMLAREVERMRHE